jgi:hypothetical protein
VKQRLVTVLVGLLVAALAGCAGARSGNQPGRRSLPPAIGAESLSDVCPRTVVIQEAWEPQADVGGRFELLGQGYAVDVQAKRVSGPLVVHGRDTGVQLELRSGGPAIGFRTVPAQLYLDPAITLGAVPADIAIGSSANQPINAVIAPVTKSPLILMWDPASHPDWRSIADVGSTSATVLMANTSNAAALLVARRLIKPGQLDTGYTGGPARFLANPTIVQQGYVTNEPYLYERELSGWRKPVRYQLLADVGYQVYPDLLAVRTPALTTLAPCLTRLVPILQRAQADYLANPRPINQRIVEVRSQYDHAVTYSRGVADYATEVSVRLGLVANDTSGPLGGIDLNRLQATIDTFAPLLSASGAAVRPGLTAADLATARFIDPTVRLR